MKKWEQKLSEDSGGSVSVVGYKLCWEKFEDDQKWGKRNRRREEQKQKQDSRQPGIEVRWYVVVNEG